MKKILLLSIMVFSLCGFSVSTSFSQNTEKNSLTQANYSSAFEEERIEVMFSAESKVRMRDGNLSYLATQALKGVDQILSELTWYRWHRLTDVPESNLDSWETTGERNTGIYFAKPVPKPVELPSPPPGSFQSQQGYLNPAEIGELVANNNGWGTTGICNGSNLKTCGTYYGLPTPTWNVAGAIALAVASLTAGDIILLEQQWEYSPTQGTGCFIPIEWWGSKSPNHSYGSKIQPTGCRLSQYQPIRRIHPRGGGRRRYNLHCTEQCQDKYEFSLSSQSPGVYILHVITGKETGTVKIIKQ